MLGEQVITEAPPDDPHIAHAMALTTRAMTLGAESNHADACKEWQAASDCADEHLAGLGIDHWIKSGLGSALYDAREYERAIMVSRMALGWCIGQKAVLPSLAIAKSLLKPRNPEAAIQHVRQARDLRGDRVIEALDPADRATIRNRLQA